MFLLLLLAARFLLSCLMLSCLMPSIVLDTGYSCAQPHRPFSLVASLLVTFFTIFVWSPGNEGREKASPPKTSGLQERRGCIRNSHHSLLQFRPDRRRIQHISLPAPSKMLSLPSNPRDSRLKYFFYEGMI